MRQVQLIGEIGTQVSDIVRTEGQLKADKEARAELKARGIEEPGEGASEKVVKAYQDQLIATDAYQRIMGKYGTGGDYQRVSQAVTAALQGLVGGDIGGALAGASAPYLAGVIKQVAGDNNNVRIMAHAVLGAVVAQAQGNSAIAGAAGATTGELIAAQIYPGKPRDELSEEEKQTVSALATLASGLAGAATGGGLGDAVAAGQAGRNAVENNSLSDIAEAVAAGKTLEVVAGERVEAENERFKQENCAGLSSDACSVKMYEQRRENLQDIASTGADFVPVVGDIKSFAEAESALDYLAAAVGVFPGVGALAGKALKAARAALRKGDLAEASRLINESSAYIASGTKEVVHKNPNPSSALTDAEAGSTGLPRIGSLKGEPELPPKNANADMIRSIERQNEAAKSLARAGYNVEQLANTGKKGANPDLRINGELADVASPRTGSVGSVLMTINDKVRKQASSVVINLADSPLTINQLGDALSVRPVEGLKNLYIMKNGEFKVIEVAK